MSEILSDPIKTVLLIILLALEIPTVIAWIFLIRKDFKKVKDKEDEEDG